MDKDAQMVHALARVLAMLAESGVTWENTPPELLLDMVNYVALTIAPDARPAHG